MRGPDYPTLFAASLAILVLAVVAAYHNPDDKCETAYYQIFSVNRCLEVSGCFTMRKDFHEAKLAHDYYDSHCAQYEKDRLEASIKISPEGKNETSLDTRYTSP